MWEIAPEVGLHVPILSPRCSRLLTIFSILAYRRGSTSYTPYVCLRCQLRYLRTTKGQETAQISVAQIDRC